MICSCDEVSFSTGHNLNLFFPDNSVPVPHTEVRRLCGLFMEMADIVTH